MIDTTSERNIITNLISNVLGEDRFTINLSKLIALNIQSDNYVCEVEFLKDSSNLPVIFIYEKENKSLGYWRSRETSEYWEVESFNWEETFNQLQYYVNYYADLLKDFYNVNVYELDSYYFQRNSRNIDLKKLGKGSNIVYKFSKKF